jgi:hypothetical protein
MAPSAIDTPMPPLPVREAKFYPPARIFNVKETKFEKYVAPQTDGREKALAMPEGEAAIVIDNGPATRSYHTMNEADLKTCTRFLRRPSWLVLRSEAES